MKRSLFKAAVLTLVLALGFAAGQLTAAQPHMRDALNHLRAARNDLNKASSDKGGHRNKALALVNDAIDQVERGIAYDRRH